MSMMMGDKPSAPVMFGVGCINEIGDKIKELGGTKPLLCYDPGVRDCGLGPRVADIIRNAGYDLIVYDEVIAEPPVELIDKLKGIALENGVDILIGLGGGSAMDTAKATAFMCKHEGATADWLGVPPDFIGLPAIAIPTNSGTGSEVSYANVISNPALNIKGPVVYGATLAILDPELTLTAPRGVSALCGMDALAHACESLTGNMTNPHSGIIAKDAISRIVKWLPTVIEDPSNLEARTQLSLGSNFAGQAFNESFIHFGHGMAETVGPFIHMPHGMVCALSLPACMEYVGDCADIHYIKDVAGAMDLDISDIAEDGSAIGMRVADAIRDIMHQIKVPSYKDKGISREEIMCHAAEVAESFHNNSAPTPMTVEIATKYLARSYDAYLEA